MNKVRTDAQDALDGLLYDGMTIAVGGFGLCGVPYGLIDVVRNSGVGDLTIVSNNMGTDGHGLGVLLEEGQVRKVVGSYVGENRTLERLVLSGELEIEFTPQGTLAERLRAGGSGIPAFYTPSGVGTVVADGKPTRSFEGVTYLLERAIVADLALVHAHTADPAGNLRYRYTAQNFNPLVAMAGRTTIAEAEVIRSPGFLEPDEVRTPGIFVDHVVPADPGRKPIEQRTVRTAGETVVR
ncbi:CoA transferase subunit A [Amycolatopsis pigmentata]|uniref:CoA transferase subunit A n=1 Tax=Amycolatopsis pigmentata TaxID=450801 RepID=A0ABW5FKX7_9PSEU